MTICLIQTCTQEAQREMMSCHSDLLRKLHVLVYCASHLRYIDIRPAGTQEQSLSQWSIWKPCHRWRSLMLNCGFHCRTLGMCHAAQARGHPREDSLRFDPFLCHHTLPSLNGCQSKRHLMDICATAWVSQCQLTHVLACLNG